MAAKGKKKAKKAKKRDNKVVDFVNRKGAGRKGGNPDIIAAGYATRFQPGHSVKSPGRPRGSVLLSEALRFKLEDKVEGDPQGRTYAEFIADRAVIEAAKGNIGFVAFIADRVEGRAVDRSVQATFRYDLTQKEQEEAEKTLALMRRPAIPMTPLQKAEAEKEPS